MGEIQTLNKVRTTMFFLYFISAACIFIPSHFVLQLLGACFGIASVFFIFQLNRKILEATYQEHETQLKRGLVPSPDVVIIEDEPPDIEIVK